MDYPLLDRILSTVDDPYLRLEDDMLDDFNRVLTEQGEPLLDELPESVWWRPKQRRVLRVVK